MKDFVKVIGPGLLFAGASIGVSHLVQSTRAGADYGYGLLWALLLVHLFKYPFFQFGPRYALATGENLLDGYRRLGKSVLVIYFVLTFCTMFTIQTAVTIVTAGLASRLFGFSDDAVLWSILITLVCLLILVIGRYKLLDRFIKFVVAILAVSTLLAVIFASSNSMGNADFTQILPGDTAGIAFLIAFMGWMPAPLDISVWHSLWAIEKKNNQPAYDHKAAIKDFNFGFAGAIILGVCFVALGALVMYGTGEKFDNSATGFASQLITMYTDSLGEWTYIIIALAAFTAMFSTTLTTLDASPRAMAHTSKLLFGKYIRHSYIFWMGALVVGTCGILFFFLSEMKVLIDIATILSFVTAPFYALANYILITSSHTPEKYRPGLFMRIMSLIGILFLISFSIWYLMNLEVF